LSAHGLEGRALKRFHLALNIADEEPSPPGVMWRGVLRKIFSADRNAVEIRQTWP
jgi:hypothetical protein